MPKNKTILIAISILLIIVLPIASFFIFKNKTSTPKQAETHSQSDIVEELSAQEIGLKIEASPDKKKIQFTIDKAAGIKAISYELTYEADPSREEQADGAEEKVQRGVIGDAKIQPGKSNYSSPWLDLGSCSKNVCKYDVGVQSVKLVLKITKNGKIYHTEGNLEL